MAQWLRLCAPNAEGQGSIPGQGTGSHMPQLKSSHAATKTHWLTDPHGPILFHDNTKLHISKTTLAKLNELSNKIFVP